MRPEPRHETARERHGQPAAPPGVKDRERCNVPERGQQNRVPPPQREDQMPPESREDQAGQRGAAAGKQRSTQRCRLRVLPRRTGFDC